MEAKGSQPLGIGWYRVVREIAADRLRQPPLLLRNRCVHPPTQFPFKGLQLDPHPICWKYKFELKQDSDLIASVANYSCNTGSPPQPPPIDPITLIIR